MSTEPDDPNDATRSTFVTVSEEGGPTIVAHRIPKNSNISIPASLENVSRSFFFIHRLYLDAKLGSSKWEHDGVQPLAADVKYQLPHGLSCLTDRLGDTVDHLTVAKELRKYALSDQHHSLEALATGMIHILRREFRFDWMSLALTRRRPHPVIEEGITLEFGVGPSLGASSRLRLWGAED